MSDDGLSSCSFLQQIFSFEKKEIKKPLLTKKAF